MNRLSKNNKKAKGIRDNDRRRAKKYGVEYDSSITLKKLVARDGLRCAICGGMCDWSDTKWGYSGPTYPSKDHIIPMAKGGPHIWENMQVAHVMCNSEKGDRVSV
jgi:5-methylcytosine-specific restriction endonuclease McrA